MTDDRRQRLALAVIATVCLVKWAGGPFDDYLHHGVHAVNFFAGLALQVLYYLIPALLALSLFYPPGACLGELGLNRGVLRGLLAAGVFTLPMLAGYALLGRYDDRQDFLHTALSACKAGFREELFYRAFLFGQLFRRAKWGFIPAAGVNGLVFGLAHLYQARSLGESAAIFTVTFAGALWFAWLLIEWKNNLWVPIGLHALMNLYWDLFGGGRTALGGVLANLPRLLTIALSIYVTIKLGRGSGGPAVTRRSLFRQH